LPSDELFPRTTPAMAAATDGAAWLAAMLEVEQALASAEEELGLIPPGTARDIEAAAGAAPVTVALVRDEAAAAGTPVMPLLRSVTAVGGESVAEWLHWGATTQDVVDTALALIVRRAGRVLAGRVGDVAAALASLADGHRHTVMAGRTLLQQGAPTTFGLKAAGWLVALLDAGDRCAAAVRAVPAQLGGAVGTLSVFAGAGPDVVARLAARLDLAEPVLPWHAERGPIAELGAALGAVSGVAGKIAGDLVLLGQTEVGEVRERAESGRGVSSALPGKQNPVAAVAARSAARRAAPIAQALSTAFDHEHERAAGAWQAEAPMVCDLLGLVALAVDATADALDGLVVDEARMRANIEPAVAAQGVADLLATAVGRHAAHEIVTAAVERARTSGRPLRTELLADRAVVASLGEAGLDAALDPIAGVGAAGVLVDRALSRWNAVREVP
jgi:3-carboxy-cis,cis-muconate cycloisomerase